MLICWFGVSTRSKKRWFHLFFRSMLLRWFGFLHGAKNIVLRFFSQHIKTVIWGSRLKKKKDFIFFFAACSFGDLRPWTKRKISFYIFSRSILSRWFGVLHEAKIFFLRCPSQHINPVICGWRTKQKRSFFSFFRSKRSKNDRFKFFFAV